MSDEAITDCVGTSHSVECRQRYDGEMARKAVNDALRGPAKHQLNRRRARQRARAKRRRVTS